MLSAVKIGETGGVLGWGVATEMLDDYSGLGDTTPEIIGSMDGNTGRSEGATAEKAVPCPCVVLDPNRSFVELRVGEPRPGARSVSHLCRTPIRPNGPWKVFGVIGPSPMVRLDAGQGAYRALKRLSRRYDVSQWDHW